MERRVRGCTGGGAIKVFVDGRGEEEKLNICTAPLCVSLCVEFIRFYCADMETQKQGEEQGTDEIET